MKRLVIATVLAGLALTARGENLSGLCMVSVPRDIDHGAEKAEVVLRQSNCEEGRGCNSSDNSNVSWSRWTGITANTLAQEGAQLDAQLKADAGELCCTGTVHDGVL